MIKEGPIKQLHFFKTPSSRPETGSSKLHEALKIFWAPIKRSRNLPSDGMGSFSHASNAPSWDTGTKGQDMFRLGLSREPSTSEIGSKLQLQCAPVCCPPRICTP